MLSICWAKRHIFTQQWSHLQWIGNQKGLSYISWADLYCWRWNHHPKKTCSSTQPLTQTAWGIHQIASSVVLLEFSWHHVCQHSGEQVSNSSCFWVEPVVPWQTQEIEAIGKQVKIHGNRYPISGPVARKLEAIFRFEWFFQGSVIILALTHAMSMFFTPSLN